MCGYDVGVAHSITYIPRTNLHRLGMVVCCAVHPNVRRNIVNKIMRVYFKKNYFDKTNTVFG